MLYLHLLDIFIPPTSTPFILTTGLEPVVVENVLNGDELTTDIAGVEKCIHDLGAESVACVLTTTSCFAPRAVDK